MMIPFKGDENDRQIPCVQFGLRLPSCCVTPNLTPHGQNGVLIKREINEIFMLKA
jgi:hypothetical protein